MLVRTKVRVCLLAICAVLCVYQPASAEVIFREIFPNTTGNPLYGAGAGNDGSVAAGWNSHRETGGDLMPVGNDGAHIVYGTGKPSYPGLPAVNSNLNSAFNTGPDADSTGFIRGWQHAVNQVIFWTEEYEIDRGLWNIDTISWYQGHNGTNDKSRVALRVDTGSGEVWYVSNSTFNQDAGMTQGQFATNAEFKSLTFAGETWSELTFVPGSSLSNTPGVAGTLPSGNITAFGLYSKANESEGYHRFDTFTIEATAVPEPSAITLGAIGLLWLLCWWRIKSTRLQGV